MTRSILILIVLIHGLIHLLGFAKAFHLGQIAQLTRQISKPVGLLWLLAAVLFVISAVLILAGNTWWPLGIFSIMVSQVLITTAWQDAKFGTIANIIILLAAILAFGSWRFENTYRKDVQAGLAGSKTVGVPSLTEADIQRLPHPVQQYLRYSGALNRPRVHNMKITLEGEMRERGKDWFPFKVEQYSFFDVPTRLFFMKAYVWANRSRVSCL